MNEHLSLASSLESNVYTYNPATNQDQKGERIQGRISSMIPEMLPITEVCKRIPGLSYDFLRKGCLSGKIVHIRVGNGKFLINFGRLVEWLNTSCGGSD